MLSGETVNEGTIDGVPAVSVVIVNWNGAALLPECLDALAAQTHSPAEVIVVDNGSTDDSCALLSERYRQVRVIALPENRYFCAGANTGLRAAISPFILLLNNDCILDPGYIEMALKPLLRDESVGAVTGKIRRVHGDLLDSCGQMLARSRKPLDRGYGKADDGSFDEEEAVFSAGGVAPLLRRTMLEDVAVGGQYFDEAFVQYYEDLDLFWRARNLGWKSWYTPAATAKHYRGASGQQKVDDGGWISQFAFANLPEHLQKHLLKNRYAAMAKNGRFIGALLDGPWILAYELKILTYIVLVRPRLFGVWMRAVRFVRHGRTQRLILDERARSRGLKPRSGGGS